MVRTESGPTVHARRETKRGQMLADEERFRLRYARGTAAMQSSDETRRDTPVHVVPAPVKQAERDGSRLTWVREERLGS